MALNVTDIAVRLNHLRCCIADKADSLVNKKKYGVACDEDEIELMLLTVYQWIICGYTVGSDNNQVTEVELNHIFDQISRRCNIAFAVEGANYLDKTPVPESFSILLNSGDNILLNDSSNILLNN